MSEPLDAMLQTRIPKQIKERFEQIAKNNKRRPADFLRLLIEDRVESEAKPQRRQPVTSK